LEQRVTDERKTQDPLGEVAIPHEKKPEERTWGNEASMIQEKKFV